MNGQLGSAGVINVVPLAALEAHEQKMAQEKASAQQAMTAPPQSYVGLVGYIKAQFEIMRNHRNTTSGWSERLLHALRTFNGQYDATKLGQIRQFGGSEVYMRTTAQKCRAAASLLRDIYISRDRPWGVRPPADPDIPPSIQEAIDGLLRQEQQMVAQQLGRPPSPQDMQKRKTALLESAQDAAKKKASSAARESEDRIEDLLRAGGYYTALAEFLIDLPIFPFAVIKGPVVKVIPTVQWPKGGGAPKIEQKPTLTWNRVSPFDIWFTPGVSDIENANVIEKLRITRAELNDLLDLPGYNHEEILAVLDEYGRGGLYDNWDGTDAERAVLENKENPAWNRSGLLSMMEFNGHVQGRTLQEYGLAVPNELRDYHVQVWCIGSHVIKAHLSPSPRQRHPYFVTSYEKVPGSVVGNSLVDLLSDLQEAMNATLRALINNMSISSGPQVVIEDDRLVPGTDNDTLFPWKRWHARNDPMSNNTKPPVSFFMPTSNAQTMIETLKEFMSFADDVSAIPKYVGGSGGGGAGRTASGLAMLMGNASKILQTVSANIDRDVIEPSLGQLTDLIMLTDTTGMLTGEEKIRVLGVNVAIQRETLRQRQIEFLQATANPLDQKIVGIKGRARLLRAVSTDLGISGEDIVPDEEILERMQEDEKKNAASASIDERVEKGVQMGVEAGVKRISTEIVAGELAMRQEMPLGNPGHLGSDAAPAGPGIGQPPATNNPEMDLGAGGDAARAQGAQSPRGSKGMAPQTNTVQSQNPSNRPSPGIG
jgi:hypothetical protein